MMRIVTPGRAFLTALLVAVLAAAGVRAAVVAEGTYTVTAPERRTVRFRLLVTPTGARVTPSAGETLVFSHAKKSALVLDTAGRSYFVLPLELVPPLLAAGLGYDPRGLGAVVSGTTRDLLGHPCSEVVVSGKAPKTTLRTWRATEAAWSRDWAHLERSLGLPWAVADPPAALVGLPLAGTVDVAGPRPYRASWEITKLTREEGAGEDFAVPAGYRMDLERLMSVQGGGAR